MTVAKFGIGQPVRRVEDHRFITGDGRYTDDHAPYGCFTPLSCAARTLMPVSRSRISQRPGRCRASISS